MSRHRGQTFKDGTIEFFNSKAFYDECAKHKLFIVDVEKYDNDTEISLQQMAYLHAVVYPTYGKFIGLSNLGAEVSLKRKCGPKNKRGENRLVRKFDNIEMIMSKKSLTVRQTNEFIDNIYDFCNGINCFIPPPDPEWKKKKNGNN